jgi:hypothetical protein
MSNEEIVIARLSFELAKPSAGEAADAARIQRGIDATMRAVVADRYNPVLRKPSPTVTVVGAAPVITAGERGTGWVEPRPIASPMPKGSFLEGVVGAMIDRALGPALPKAKSDARE